MKEMTRLEGDRGDKAARRGRRGGERIRGDNSWEQYLAVGRRDPEGAEQGQGVAATGGNSGTKEAGREGGIEEKMAGVGQIRRVGG